MPRPRFSRLDPARRQRILHCAAQAFAAHGYKGASLNRIIEALGLNKGVFYYYFDGKADLFGAVLQMVWDSFLPLQAFDVNQLDRDSFWPGVESMLRDNYARLRDEPWLAGLLRLLSSPPETTDMDAVVGELLARGEQWVRTIIEHGQRVGAVRTDLPVDLLLAVLTAADHAGDRWLLGNWERFDDGEREHLSLRVFDLWRRIAAPQE